MYEPLFMLERDSQQWKVSDQIIRALYSDEIPLRVKEEAKVTTINF